MTRASFKNMIPRWPTLVWLGCLVFVVVFYTLIYRPKQRQLYDLSRDVAKARGYDEALTLASTSPSRKKRETEIATLQERSDRICFPAEQLNTLDFRLHDMATQSRLDAFSAKNLFERGDKRLKGCKHIQQRFVMTSFSATFPSFLRFMNALERYSPTLFVSQFRIEQRYNREPEENLQPAAYIEFFALSDAN